jgi:putative Ca2+/H+ antiporter (TMEM165/GDT1 family)
MEQKKITTHIVKGLLLTFVVIVIGLVGYLTKAAEKPGYSWIGNVVLFGGIIWGCIYYAQQMDGQVTFGNIFAHGFKMTAVVSVLLVVYTLLAVYVLFPDMKDKAMEIARQRMEDKGNLSDQQIESSMDIAKKYFNVILIVGVCLGTLIIGVLASLLGAAVSKKNQVNPLQQIDQLDQMKP